MSWQIMSTVIKESPAGFARAVVVFSLKHLSVEGDFACLL